MLKYDSELSFWKNRFESEKEIFKNSHYRKLMLAMAGEANERFLDGKIVADFGCGPRGSLAWAASALARIGIDVLADAYAEHFKSNITSHGMVYVKSTENTIPVSSDYVDVLYTLNAMDHMDDFKAMCEEIIRIIKPGGEFIGSFNLETRPTSCEPQRLTEEILNKNLLDHLRISSYRIVNRGPGNTPYLPFFEEGMSYKSGKPGFLWVRAQKPAMTIKD